MTQIRDIGGVPSPIMKISPVWGNTSEGHKFHTLISSDAQFMIGWKVSRTLFGKTRCPAENMAGYRMTLSNEIRCAAYISPGIYHGRQLYQAGIFSTPSHW